MSLSSENRICGNIKFEKTNSGKLSFINKPQPLGSLYDFTTFTFSSVGICGRTGPPIQCFQSCYSQTVNWACDTNYFTTGSAGIQLWTVPETATYELEVAGAQGTQPTSITGGRGVVIRAQYTLTQGEKIQLLVGQTAPVGNTTRVNKSSSGGGGSFAVKYTGQTNTICDILIIAGGGGGSGGDRPFCADATTLTCGYGGRAGGAGGRCGCGGIGTSANGGGGGFLTNGTQSGCGIAFINGGFGGAINDTYARTGGGFGGGGSPQNGLLFRYSGGGGFSGGGASNTFGNLDGSGDTNGHWGGGGGSYIQVGAINVATTNGCYNGCNQFGGNNITNLGTYNTGSGYIKITKL